MAFEPSWLRFAREDIGLRETPGPASNKTILQWLAELNARWLGGDAAPWCGTAMAHWMKRAGIPYPKDFYRAKAWMQWGKPRPKANLGPGTVLVFDREGGGHVALYVGQDETHYHCLGGNQGDAVNIRRFPKVRCVAWRWPSTAQFTGSPVRLTAAGVPVSNTEA